MRYESKDFLGLTPAIDKRRSEKLFALAGKNYVLDSLGPKSSFGNRLLTTYPLGLPNHVQGGRLRLRTGDRAFTFTGDGIIEWSESLGTWRFIYVTGNTTIQPYRWTYGYINGIMYFCHPAVGILAYTIDSDSIQPLIGEGVPSEPICVLVNNGRLIVVDDLYYSWSAPGDGTDFRPRLGGAGQQKIADRVPGFPIMLSGYARGTLTWTTGGVMRSEFTGDAAVFRHRAINTEYRPINSFCTIQMDDNTVVFLDERGLFQSQGETPTPLTPMFNEFLIDYLQRFNLKLGQNVRLEWDDLQRLLYLSISLSESSPLYERAFVLYPPLDKWGTFDEEHFGILPLLVNQSSREDDYFGFVDSRGLVKYWKQTGSREAYPTNPSLDSVYHQSEKPPHRVSGDESVILSSSMTINTVNEITYSQRSGMYPAGGESPATGVLEGLDSVLQLGLVRGRSDASLDQLIEVSAVFVGSAVSGEKDQLVEDFTLIPPGTLDEDYNAAVGTEDFGFESQSYVNHGIRMIGTVDGESVFYEQIPQLVRFDQNGRYFACSIPGLWHIIELSAKEAGEYFHVKSLELTATPAGSLN